MRFRFGTTTRIALALAVVAAVVAVDHLTAPNLPRVLGQKLTRCSVGGEQIAVGPRRLDAEGLSVAVRDGKPGAVLAPPFKVTPGARSSSPAATLGLGVRRGGRGTLAATVVVQNATTCTVAVGSVRVWARLTPSAPEVVAVTFGGRSRVLLSPGRSVTGRVLLPAATDGTWLVEASASADVGAAS